MTPPGTHSRPCYKELTEGSEFNRLYWATDNGSWLTVIPHLLNVTELSTEEFQDNLILRYGIFLLNLPTDCDGCDKKLLVPNALSCPKGSLVLLRRNDVAKEWGSLSSRALNPSCISYKPKINSGTVQGERNGAGARVATVGQDGGGGRRGRGSNGTGNGAW